MKISRYHGQVKKKTKLKCREKCILAQPGKLKCHEK